MISLWPQNKQLLTSMVLHLFKFSLKPRVCSFLVTRFMWLKIWVQLVLDVRLHPFLLESIFYSLASLLSSGCTISGEERRCLCSGGVYLLSQLEWSLLFPAQLNARHAHAQCLTSPCWAEVSHSSVHRFVSHNCFFTGNLFCLMLVQSPFLWIGVLLGRFFCSFLFILTTQLCLKRDSCRQHMAISCFPNLFQQSLS